jgi:alkylation response protein AidB-like acyl-CoA dehydrogenase
MDFRESPAEREVRTSVRNWLSQSLPQDWRGEAAYDHRSLEDWYALRQRWHRTLHSAGLLPLRWPVAYGGFERGLGDEVILHQELARAEAPTINWVGIAPVAETLLLWGTESQKLRYLPPLARGDATWCQALSEPSAGSDLVAATMTATRSGDTYELSGSKTWVSWAGLSDYILVLARTGAAEQRGRSLSCFIVPTDAPGVTIKPIALADDQRECCDVLFEAVKVPVVDRIGPEDGGWQVVFTGLEAARGLMASWRATDLGGLFQHLLRRVHAARDRDGLRALAREYVRLEAFRHLGYRVAFEEPERLDHSQLPPVAKNVWSASSIRLASIALETLGPGRAFSRGFDDAVSSQKIWKLFMRARGTAIEGGTTDIHRDQIAKRALGLTTRDPR